MMTKDKSGRDAFAMGLGGIRAVASFAMVPAIPDDRLRQDTAAMNCEPREKWWRLWMPRRLRVARGV